MPPRDAAYDAFARKLKAVIENNDEATLRRLVAPEFSKGRWRAGPGQTRTIDEAIDFIRAVRPVRVSGAYVVDIERPAWNSIEIERQGVRAIVARWQANDGTEEFDHLGVSLVNGEWRWTGLSTALPFYHSPTLSTFRPNALSFFDVMLVGEYRGHNVDGEIKDAQSSPTAFVLKDISGNSIWVAYYEWVLQLPLKPNDRASIGKLVRVLAQAQVGFLHAHWVTLATPADYATATGAIQSISNDPRKLVVQTADGSLHNITFFETTNINDTNDCNVTMTALKNGTRVTVMGRPAPENAVIAEQIYILPATGPDWKVTNHIQVFYDGNLFRRRDLLTNSETTIPNDGKMWNWKCN